MSAEEEVLFQDPDQLALFGDEPSWAELWKGMPTFSQQDLEPWRTVKVHFRNRADARAFSKLVGQNIHSDSAASGGSTYTKNIWFPGAEIGHFANKRFVTAHTVWPQYPIYIISKGRWESRMTARALEQIGIPYRIVVEPQELEQYASVIDRGKILTLPFSNLGLGSIPARNWVWEHSVANGDRRHWILDDNLDGFFRLFENLKIPVKTGATFRAIEDFVDRYENAGIAGMNYFMFAPRKSLVPPLTLNTRIYSCILIQNDIPYRWRGRYNEDTDLSIRALKDGWCTVLFNAFLARKQTTMTMAGGNTEELYKDDGRLKMAESLHEQHPDIVQVTEKWVRFQHHVDYRAFKRNRLRLRPGAAVPDSPNDYGMKLEILSRQ